MRRFFRVACKNDANRLHPRIFPVQGSGYGEPPPTRVYRDYEFTGGFGTRLAHVSSLAVGGRLPYKVPAHRRTLRIGKTVKTFAGKHHNYQHRLVDPGRRRRGAVFDPLRRLHLTPQGASGVRVQIKQHLRPTRIKSGGRPGPVRPSAAVPRSIATPEAGHHHPLSGFPPARHPADCSISSWSSSSR